MGWGKTKNHEVDTLMRLYEDATRHFVTECFGPVGRNKKYLAVRSRYEGGVGENKKHKVNTIRCAFFWLFRVRKQKHGLYEQPNNTT